MRCIIPYNDLDARLNQTYIMYDGTPYYCTVSEGCLRLYKVWQRPPDDKAVHKLPYDNLEKNEKLDIASIQLGYVNYKNRAIYLSRIPRRFYKQGITGRVIRQSSQQLRIRIDASNMLASQEFVSACQDEYPDLHQALLMMKSKSIFSMAISKNVCLSKNLTWLKEFAKDYYRGNGKPAEGMAVKSIEYDVYYKDCHVGVYDTKENQLLIPAFEESRIYSEVMSTFNWSVV